MTPAQSTDGRAAWSDLPAPLRADIEAHLGAPVRTAVNQNGGFSTGLAARVRCADGRRAFVKAVGTPLHPGTPDLFRAEARIAAALPAAVPAPRLRHCYDDGEWVALVFDEVDGVMPEMPWRRADLDRVLTALADLATALTPCPLSDVPSVADVLAHDMLAYQRLAADPPADLDPWERAHLADLADLAESALSTLDGDTLVHLDVRGDNVLLTADGVMFVDWPWAARGAGWIDTAVLGIDAALHGHDPDALLTGHPLLTGIDLTPLLAGLAGMWAESSRRDPAGLPALRQFQRAEGGVALAWVRRRTGWD